MQNQKIWKSHPRWQTQGLSPCCWKLSGGWPWCFLHLTSIRTSIRVHFLVQQSKEVLNPVKPGVARFNYCNFWYVPWDTLCTAPAGAFFKTVTAHGVMARFFCRSLWGMETTAVNKGWNAMMDESYLNITMKYLGSWRSLGWKDQSEMPWFKCVFLSENTYYRYSYRSTLFNSYMKWSCKRQLWIEMARVVLHSAICWGKASQHSDSSLTNKTLMTFTVNIFWHSLTQKLPLVPFSNWTFLWVKLRHLILLEVHGIARSTCAVFGLPALQGTLVHSSHRQTSVQARTVGRSTGRFRLGRSWKDHSRWKCNEESDEVRSRKKRS